MKKVAVVLSGCGHRDGAEITETVSALIGLSQAGASYSVFAPEMKVAVVNHQTGQPTGEQRSLRDEAARISRGNVKDVKELRASDFDALVFPGGMGAALNLCTWASEGARCRVNSDVEKVIRAFHSEEKPIGGICIAPALLARVLGSEGVTVTIGDDDETAQEIEKTGASHEKCAVDDFVTDRTHRIVTTPAYMYGSSTPAQIFEGVRKAMIELVGMA